MHRSQTPAEDVAQIAAAIAERLRTRSPRVHCITNAVAQNFTANGLLAAGCVPSMTHSPEEIAGFVGRADALLINLGTFDRERRQSAEIAAATAAEKRVPWVLDPVFVDRSVPRANFARALIQRGPKALRLNAAEFSVLAGGEPTPEALAAYASEHGLVVALSGETDCISDASRTAMIGNGHSLMAKVTAMGCFGSALLAAALAVEPDTWRAAAAALAILSVAGEFAAEKANGPGSFAVAIIDALYLLDPTSLRTHAKVT